MELTTGVQFQVKVELCDETGRVEVTKYNKPIKMDLANNFKGGSETNEKQYEDNKRKTILKSAKRIMQLVRYNANQYRKENGSAYPPVFLTLTFSENIQDWDYANREFSKFIQRLNYSVYGRKCTELRYVGVPELQDRGAIHYHILFFNLPYVDKKVISLLWGHGYTEIEVERMKDMQGESLGKYITKYMIKQFYPNGSGKDKFCYDKEKWEGKKVYFASKNLYRPNTFRISQEEYLDISWLLEGEEFSSDLIIAKLKMQDGTEEAVEFGNRDIYPRVYEKKVDVIKSILLSCKDKYIKTDFAIGQKNVKNAKRMIRLDKVVKESPKERYARIKENLRIDNMWDRIGEFVEVFDMEYVF